MIQQKDVEFVPVVDLVVADLKYNEVENLEESELKKYALECNNYFKEVYVRN